jgi:hypothetical protein
MRREGGSSAFGSGAAAPARDFEKSRSSFGDARAPLPSVLSTRSDGAQATTIPRPRPGRRGSSRGSHDAPATCRLLEVKPLRGMTVEDALGAGLSGGAPPRPRRARVVEPRRGSREREQVVKER